jgi:predicted DNA-binding protein
MPLKTSKLDLRIYNVPPINNSVKRFDTTVSFRIERELVEELELLLGRRYYSKNVPMRNLSFVLRSAVKKKIKELKDKI